MALGFGQMQPSLEKADIRHSPIRPGYWHVCLDDSINTNPLVFRSVALEGNTGMPANKAATTIRTDQVLTIIAVSRILSFSAPCDAPLQLDCLLRPLVNERRSDSIRIRTSTLIHLEIDTLHPLTTHRSNFFEFHTKDRLSVHLSQHQRKVISRVFDVLHERPHPAGQTITQSAIILPSKLLGTTHILFPSL
jgi:hypothetical protein